MKSTNKYSIGVDIGGTNIKLGVVDDFNRIIEKTSVPTRKADGADAILQDIINLCQTFCQKYPVEAIGIGSPGDLDEENRCIIEAGNLPFHNVPIVDTIEKATGIRTFLDNDGNCALHGEKYAGEGLYINDMVVMTIGTGIGGGLMLDGKVYHGHNNRAGEIGHFVINYNGPRCTCGLRGCLEQYASASALIRQAKEAVREHPESALLTLAGSADKIDGQVIFRAYRAKDPTAEQVIDTYMNYLAVGLNSLVMIFQPEIIVLAGGITGEGEGFLAPLRKFLLPDTNVCISKLHNDAGLVGASLLYKINRG